MAGQSLCHHCDRCHHGLLCAGHWLGRLPRLSIPNTWRHPRTALTSTDPLCHMGQTPAYGQNMSHQDFVVGNESFHGAWLSQPNSHHSHQKRLHSIRWAAWKLLCTLPRQMCFEAQRLGLWFQLLLVKIAARTVSQQLPWIAARAAAGIARQPGYFYMFLNSETVN